MIIKELEIVHGGASFKKLVKLGKYGWHDKDATERNFFCEPEKTARKIKIFLVCLEKRLLTSRAVIKLRALNFKPVGFVELLEIGAQHPKEQIYGPIVAFGSPCFDIEMRAQRFIFLGVSKRRRALCVTYPIDDGCGTEEMWESGCFFAVIKDEKFFKKPSGK